MEINKSPPKNITDISNLIKIIPEHCAKKKKMKVNPSLLYSTLKPETSSDFPATRKVFD